MRRAALSVLSAIALLSATTAANAKGVSASATLSETRVYTGEVVTLEVITVASRDGDVEIEVPPVDGLEELRRGQSDSTSISWTSAGQSLRRERTLRIDFEAKKPGKLVIPPIEVRLGGERVATEPLTIEVTGSVSSDSSAAAVAPVPGEVAPPEAGEEEIFVRYRTDKARAYVGEQILVDLEIFTAGAFNLEDTKPPPSPDGFWREIVQQSQQLEARPTRVGGRSYRAYRLWRIALFALAPGEKVVPPVQLTFTQSRGMFDSGRRLRRSALPLRLEILPLPSQGRPRDFATGNVGRFTLAAQVDSSRVTAGKGVMLTLSLTGAGNIAGAKLPELPALDGFRTFPPTTRDQIDRRPDGVYGSKLGEMLLVPTRGGRLTIPPISLAIFDPTKGDYQRLSTEEITVLVDGDPSAAPPPIAPPAGPPDQHTLEAEEGTFEPPRPLRFRSLLEGGKPRFAGTSLHFALLAAGPLGYVLFLILVASVARLREETPASRRKKALATARARLQAAEKALDSGPALTAFSEASEVLIAHASTCAEHPLRGLTIDQARAELLAHGAPEVLVERWAEELRRCDFARFAPGGGEREDARETIKRARALLDELETFRPKGAR